jgi:putative Mn2+ efflux pump MntP
MDRVIAIVFGISCILIGLCGMFQRGFYSSKWDRYIDLGEYHYAIGIVVLMIGLLFIYTTLRRKKKN